MWSGKTQPLKSTLLGIFFLLYLFTGTWETVLYFILVDETTRSRSQLIHSQHVSTLLASLPHLYCPLTATSREATEQLASISASAARHMVYLGCDVIIFMPCISFSVRM